MDIYWHGKACFRLRSPAANLSVVTDPYKPETPDQSSPLSHVNDAVAVTISRPDQNHNQVAAVPGTPRKFDMPGEYEFSGITVRSVMTPLAEGQSRETRNVTFAISIDGITVCHLGTIARPLTAQQVESISPAHVLISPVGNDDSGLVEPRLVAQMARQMEAKIVIPMLHTPLPANEHGEPQGCQDLLRNLGVAPGAAPVQNRLTVTPNNLPSALQAMLLEPNLGTAPRRRRPSRTPS